jgi:anti-sigma regulatory factor (Ser/Thr protein kinase)
MVRRVLAPVHWERAKAALFAKASMKSLVLEFSQDIDIPCSLDPVKFERAWVNLVSNAIDFARSTIRVEAKREGARLCLRVWDDGPGVPEFFIPQLFSRGATFGKEDGTGLGLAYVRQVMRGHGGEVTYERRGGWTLFSCYVDHAFFEGQDSKMDNKHESNSGVQAKIVGLCFSQYSLAQALYHEVQRMASKSYRFSLTYEDADIVVTNDPDLALTAAEEGKIPLEMNPRLEERAILERLIRRFDLVPS